MCIYILYINYIYMANNGDLLNQQSHRSGSHAPEAPNCGSFGRCSDLERHQKVCTARRTCKG